MKDHTGHQVMITFSYPYLGSSTITKKKLVEQSNLSRSKMGDERGDV